MKRKITTAAVAASMLGGVAIGSFVAPPMAAFAADTSTSAAAEVTARTPGQWITDSLKSLVDDGTINQAQSDTIASKLKDAEPKGGRGGGHFGKDGGVMKSEKAAELLGLSQDDLRTKLKTMSLADVAKEKNVDVQTIIDALVAEQSARIDQSVADGRMTQAQADAKKAKLAERITESVNTVRPAPPARADNAAEAAPQAPAA